MTARTGLWAAIWAVTEGGCEGRNVKGREGIGEFPGWRSSRYKINRGPRSDVGDNRPCPTAAPGSPSRVEELRGVRN